VLVLVVVLVLDVLGFCGEKGIPVMILFDGSEGETSAFSSTSRSTSTSTRPFSREAPATSSAR